MEDAVGHLKGVVGAKFGGIAPQKLDVVVKKGEWVDLEEVWRLIERQGYRVRKENTHLTLRGTATKAGESWCLSVADGRSSRRLPIESSNRKATGKPMESDYPVLREDAMLEISGTVVFKDKQLRLVPSHISPMASCGSLDKPDRT